MNFSMKPTISTYSFLPGRGGRLCRGIRYKCSNISVPSLVRIGFRPGLGERSLFLCPSSSLLIDRGSCCVAFVGGWDDVSSSGFRVLRVAFMKSSSFFGKILSLAVSRYIHGRSRQRSLPKGLCHFWWTWAILNPCFSGKRCMTAKKWEHGIPKWRPRRHVQSANPSWYIITYRVRLYKTSSAGVYSFRGFTR